MAGGLCLNMIVRDEARILPRCLASLAPWITSYVIADTGSTDGTPDVIRRELRGVPGEVVNVAFEDFSQARNEALILARESSHDFASLLLSDADMTLAVDDAEALRELPAPAYAIRQHAGPNLSYANTRIVRRDAEAVYAGRTHEHLIFPSYQGMIPPCLDGVRFVDHADGSSRTVKSRRDLLLLRKTLAEDPADARALFYLAQTEREGGMYQDAIESYERHILIGGSAEEVWYSRYMIAVCHRALGREGEFVRAALRAYECRPTRAEPLHLLAQHFAEQGDVASTDIFCRIGRTIPKPTADRIFMEDEVYAHAFDDRAMASGFRSHDPVVRRRSYERCMSLAVDRSATAAARAAAVQTTGTVCLRADEAFGARLHRIRLEPIGPGYYPLNPSILSYGEDDERVAISVRWVNYKLGKIPPNRVATLNEMVVGTLAESGALRDAVRLPFDDLAHRSTEPGLVYRDARNVGYEDCRLFMWQGALWAVATVCDRNTKARPEISLLSLATGPNGVLVWECHVQRGYGSDLPQKNWSPLVTAGGDLRLIYGADPTTILGVDPKTYQASELSVHPPLLSLGGLRGGSQAVPYELEGEVGYLSVMHEVFGLAPGRRWYTHRFVWLDANLTIRHVSDPFYLYIRGIEFVAGLAAVGDDLVLSFGVEDCRAMLARAPRARVTEWLLGPSRRREKRT